MRRPTFRILAAVFVLLAAAPAVAQETGRALSQRLCAECHAIGAGGAGKDNAPAFAVIAAMPSTTRLALKVFLRSPHANMPAIMLSDGELDALADYILGLAGK